MITKNGNTEIKNVVNIMKKSKVRYLKATFVVEGIKMFREIPKGQLIKAYATQKFYDENTALFKGIDYELVSDSVFAFMSDTKTPQGILALVKMKKYTLEDILGNDNPMVMIIDNLQDPGNLGTIIRTGEGAGITGVLLSDESVDIYNPKTIRSTMGSVFRVPHLYSKDILKDIEILKSKGVNICVSHLEGSVDYTECDYTKGSAFVIGNESKGVSDAVTRKADTRIKIPMEGEVESLNAAIASAVLMYEAHRQRKNA